MQRNKVSSAAEDCFEITAFNNQGVRQGVVCIKVVTNYLLLKFEDEAKKGKFGRICTQKSTLTILILGSSFVLKKVFHC